jgi:hypothetical protein
LLKAESVNLKRTENKMAKKKDKRTNIDLQNIHIKLKIESKNLAKSAKGEEKGLWYLQTLLLTGCIQW